MALKKILLVDDDEDDRLLFLDAVREMNLQLHCDVAENGLEALQILNTSFLLPQMIFLDLNMPKMNGYEFLAHIKKETRFTTIPIVIFTTSKIEADKTLGLQAGASLFFSKPDDFVVLKKELKNILVKTLGPIAN